MGDAQVIQFASDDLLAAAVAESWLAAIVQSQAEGRKHLVALSGGRVTKKFFAATVEQSRRRKVSFESVEFFWADERCVPPDDPESNYRMADELLFKPAKIAAASVHRIEGERPPDMAAELAAAELRRVTGQRVREMPVLDLILLGMGEDGHVASLFPSDERTARDYESVFLSVENSPKPPPCRVTLGHGAIAAAREVWVLASGNAKQAALRESISRDGHTPLARVIQGRAVTKIVSDISLA